MFEKREVFQVEQFGVWTGRLFSYFLFSTILYFIFSFRGLEGFSYIYVMGVVLLLTTTGLVIKNFLK